MKKSKSKTLKPFVFREMHATIAAILIRNAPDVMNEFDLEEEQ